MKSNICNRIQSKLKNTVTLSKLLNNSFFNTPAIDNQETIKTLSSRDTPSRKKNSSKPRPISPYPLTKINIKFSSKRLLMIKTPSISPIKQLKLMEKQTSASKIYLIHRPTLLKQEKKHKRIIVEAESISLTHRTRKLSPIRTFLTPEP